MFLILSVVLAVFLAKKAYDHWMKIGQNQFSSLIGAACVSIVVFFVVGMLLSSQTVQSSRFMDAAYFCFGAITLTSLIKPDILNVRADKLNPGGKYKLRDMVGYSASILLGLGVLVNIFGSAPPVENLSPATLSVATSQTPSVAQPVVVSPEPVTANPAANPSVESNPELNEEMTVADLDTPDIESNEESSFNSAQLIENSQSVRHTKRLSCGNLPTKCGAMLDCEQAYQALACGNYRLDGDGDGVPCEKICGSN